MRTEETSKRGNPPGNTEPDRRRPFWVVDLALLGLVVVLLVGAFLLERQSRSQVGIESPPAAATGTSPAPGAGAGVQPTAQPAAAPAATVVVASPTAVESGDGLRVASSPLEREIEAAYLHYWDVLAQAYLDADTTNLPEVMSGPELGRQEQQIQDLKAQGKAAKLVAEHRIAFAKVTPDDATVYDEYLNRSVFVDPITKQEHQTSAPPETEKISFEMRKIGGTWKVVDGTRHD